MGKKRALSPETSHFFAGKLEHCPLAFFERNIGMRKTDPLQEGNDTSDSLDLADLNIVARGTRPGRDQELFHSLVADSTENPDPVPVGAFLVGVRLTDNFDAISAGGQIAESGFGDHIRCFFTQVHHPDHAFFSKAHTQASLLEAQTYDAILSTASIYLRRCGCMAVTQTLGMAHGFVQGDMGFE